LRFVFHLHHRTTKSQQTDSACVHQTLAP
jgi:hypothetical protein